MRIHASGKTALKAKVLAEISASPEFPIGAKLEEAVLAPLLGNTKTVAKKEEMLTALRSSLGIVTPACEEANISRETYDLWRQTDKEFVRRADSLLDSQLDFVEEKLLSKIKQNDTIATLFFLKCKAKHRGYVEQVRHEHTGAGGGAILTLNGNVNVDAAKQEVSPTALKQILQDILSGKATQYRDKFLPPAVPVVNVPIVNDDEREK